MGTWGVGPFENTTALDLVEAIQRAEFSLPQFQFECGAGRLDVYQAEVVIALAALLARSTPPGVHVQLSVSSAERLWIRRQAHNVTCPTDSDIYLFWEDIGEVDLWLKECNRVLS